MTAAPAVLHLVPHTHWDREWYEPFQRFRLRLVDMVDDGLERAEADPRFCFTFDGQTAMLEDYLEIRPEAEPRIQALVASGQFAVGPWRISKPQAAALFATIVVVVPALALGGYLLLRRKRPTWHRVARQWLLGKRTWLGIGIVMHLGIDVLMNVGTFVQVMIAVYIAWISGPELDKIWHTLMSMPQAPGVGDRPRYKRRWHNLLRAPIDRLRYRVPRPAYLVHHNPGDDSVRRAALLRIWDVGERLKFVTDEQLAPRRLCVTVPGVGLRCDAEAGRALVPVLPGFWWMYPWCLLPGVSRLCGKIVARTFR